MTMNSYIEIVILAGDINVNHVMSAIFSQLHLLLSQQTRVGLGWPKMDITTGNIIRLFGSHEDLSAVDMGSLARFRDYVRISSILPVPEGCAFAVYKRVQVCGKKRGKMKLSLPFIRVKSLSNGNKFRLFIEKKKVDAVKEGSFSSYGLGASVPEF